MNTATRDYPVGDLRVCDADRDRALCELSEAFQLGRITAASSTSDPSRPWPPAPGKS